VGGLGGLRRATASDRGEPRHKRARPSRSLEIWRIVEVMEDPEANENCLNIQVYDLPLNLLALVPEC